MKSHLIKQSIIILIFIILPWTSTHSQITISQSDLPSVGDTFRISLATGTAGVDPSMTGPNYNWDYSGLTSLSQDLDTFISVTSTPAVYQLVFNNFLDPNKANLASRESFLDFIPGFEIGHVYEFYRNDASGFSFLGYAGSFSGIPVPVKYDDLDRWYSYPMNYGNVDSSDVEFQFSIPGLGYIYSEKKRVNEVDGWGSLSTPFGNFQVLRMRSEVLEFDSVYIDSVGQGFGINRSFTEYKWLASGLGWPVLQVTVEGMLTTVNYLDSLQNPPSSINDHNALPASLWPNPARDNALLTFLAADASDAELRISSITGAIVCRDRLSLTAGTNQIELGKYLSLLPQGYFIVSVEGDNASWIARFVKH